MGRDTSAGCAVEELLAAGISSNCTGAGSGGVRAVVGGVTGLTGAPVPSLPEADVTAMHLCSTARRVGLGLVAAVAELLRTRHRSRHGLEADGQDHRGSIRDPGEPH